MTYQSFPVESYETDEGCKVVSQKQETQSGLLIENVALMGPASLSIELMTRQRCLEHFGAEE